MKNFRTSYIILSVLAALLTACENDIAVVNSVAAVAKEKAAPSESSKNVELYYSDSAVIRTKLITPLINHFLGEKPYYEMPQGMDAIFYDRNRKVQTKLTANYGIGYDNENGMEHMEAKGNVIVVNEKGDRLNTEHLIWNAVTKKIYNDEFVKITTKDEVIWGDGIDADQDFSKYEIKHVKGTVDVKDAAKADEKKDK